MVQALCRRNGTSPYSRSGSTKAELAAHVSPAHFIEGDTIENEGGASIGEKDCYQQLSSFHGRQKDKVWLGRDRHEKPGRLPKSEVDGEATANEYAGNRSPRSRGGPTGAIFQIFEGWCWGHGRKRLAGHAATVYPSRSVSTTSARSTPWDCAGSGGRDVALARGKVSRAAWPMNPEKGDANFMAAARLALARRPGVHG
jgi:hypothetical protein